MQASNIVVVDDPGKWTTLGDAVAVVSAEEYLAPSSSQSRTRVFNLCDSFEYQSLGYYVSLLADARGHHAIPSVATLRDFRERAVIEARSIEIIEAIQTALRGVEGTRFLLPIVFGETVDPAHAKLAAKICRIFPAPLVRVEFERGSIWRMTAIHPISPEEAETAHPDSLADLAGRYFRKRHATKLPKQKFLFDLAILTNSAEEKPPSNERALKSFAAAARDTGFAVETIATADAARICEFDALFIRETTAVDHPTYQLSRLAHAEGLVVIDDPWSILRCANKVYLAEMLAKAKLPAPRTEVLTARELESGVADRLVYPLVLKSPDGSFSKGMARVESPSELRETLPAMLEKSALVLAQEFLASEFDWRIGVLDRKPLFACKYFMAGGHWQIYNWAAADPRHREGRSETIHVEYVPEAVLDLAVRSSSLVGDGFYGVDIKQVGNRLVVIEVNDNPSVDAGIEDRALGQELYRRVARSLRRRIEQARS